VTRSSFPLPWMSDEQVASGALNSLVLDVWLCVRAFTTSGRRRTRRVNKQGCGQSKRHCVIEVNDADDSAAFTPDDRRRACLRWVCVRHVDTDWDLACRDELSPMISSAPVGHGTHAAVGTSPGAAAFWHVFRQGDGIVGDLGGVGPSVIDQLTDDQV
jgi:hypothetical protein